MWARSSELLRDSTVFALLWLEFISMAVQLSTASSAGLLEKWRQERHLIRSLKHPAIFMNIICDPGIKCVVRLQIQGKYRSVLRARSDALLRPKGGFSPHPVIESITMLFFQLILLGFYSVSALVSNLLPPATTYLISQNSTMSANEPVYNAK